MSLVYKLWKIGSVLEKKDIKDALRNIPDEGDDPEFVNIDFIFENETISKIDINNNSISREKMFFTKKIGGSGSGMYYLYPNLNLQNETLEKKITQLINTIENIKNYKLANDKNERYVEQIATECERFKEALKKKSENEITEKILQYKKGNYWFWFSINGKSFSELMPEIWDNWYKYPVTKDKFAKNGYDALTNQATEIGYKPEIKVFSYDNYTEKLKFRINENLPLSLESAKNIKFGWIYVIQNLVFYYRGLEYIIIPNFLSEDIEVHKTVLTRLKQANKNKIGKRQNLTNFEDKEKKLVKNIERLEKKKKLCDKDVTDIDKFKIEQNKIEEEIEKVDSGMIQEFEEEINETGDLKNSITLDYLFVSLNRTDLSFEIKGAIEDVIPGHISDVVKAMRDNNICELVKLKKRDKEKTFLQDFFNRKELYFALNRSSKNNKNSILREKLYITTLLLNEEKIKFNDLLTRFEKNREYNYENKKRIRKDGIKEWIEFPGTFIKNENNVIKFFTYLGKIKEESIHE